MSDVVSGSAESAEATATQGRAPRRTARTAAGGAPVSPPTPNSPLPVEAMTSRQLVRRAQLIEAVIDLVREVGPGVIQMRDVAERSGIALGTVYRYFSSKDHLYAAVLESWGRGFGTASRAVVAADPLARLETRMRTVLESFEKRPRFFRVLMLLLGSTDPSAIALLRQFRESIQGLVQADLAELDPEGAADHAVIIWAVLSTLLTRTTFHGATMADAYRINDVFIEVLRLRFAPPAHPQAGPERRDAGH